MDRGAHVAGGATVDPNRADDPQHGERESADEQNPHRGRRGIGGLGKNEQSGRAQRARGCVLAGAHRRSADPGFDEVQHHRSGEQHHQTERRVPDDPIRMIRQPEGNETFGVHATEHLTGPVDQQRGDEDEHDLTVASSKSSPGPQNRP